MVRWRGVRGWPGRRAGGDHDGGVIWRPGRPPARRPGTPTLRSWVSRLSSPWVEVLILGDHVIVCEDGELVAAGSILALPPAATEPR
jgi:hypothetical protein